MSGWATGTRPAFDEWSRELRAAGRPPRVLIVGTAGKSTVARLIDDVARAAGLRTATRVDGRVDVVGRRRPSSPAAWAGALDAVRRGAVDLAVEEAPWAELPAATGEADRVALLVVSTICPEREVCRLDETRAAITMVRGLLAAMPERSTVVVDADDPAVVSLSELASHEVAVAALRREQPGLVRCLAEGGLGAWLEDRSVVVARGGERDLVGPVAAFPLTLGGSSLFGVHNVMAASLACLGMGLPLDAVRAACEAFDPTPGRLPGSLNVLRAGSGRVIVDRASPSWLLGPLLRTLRSLRPARLTTVVDYPSSHPVEDLVEVGRLLARQSQAVVMIDEEVGLPGVMGIRTGVARTPHPPPIIHAASLPRALRRSIDGAGRDDVTLVLSPRPDLVHRILADDSIGDVA